MAEPRRRNTRQRSETAKDNDDSAWSSEQTPSVQSKKSQLHHKPKSRKRSLLKSLPVSSLTLRASGILVIAIIAAAVWNWIDELPAAVDADSVTRSFLQHICKDPDVHCHASLVPARRTQKAIQKIPTNDRVLQIPRRLLILDIDALRDPFVREQLFAPLQRKGKREGEANPPDTANNNKKGEPIVNAAAFLAAHLARLQTNSTARAALDPILQEYLDTVLPTYDHYAVFHPVLWSDAEFKDYLPLYSSTWTAVQGFKSMIAREYQTFTDRSPLWADQVSKQGYTAARLAVMTRSFGTGPLSSPASNDVGQSVSLQELDFYREHAGIDLSQGSHAMVPILDLYNHHANPNVGFAYDDSLSAFVIRAVHGGIAAGSEVMDSYGKHTDTHLFAKYGFVNGDGSGHTQATLALWHEPESIVTAGGSDDQRNKERQNLERLRAQVLGYLQYDDGYEQCVTEKDEDAWGFKIWKYRYLFQMATVPDSWTVMLAPRDPKSRPMNASNIPISDQAPRFDKQRLQFVGSTNAFFSTCRLLSLTHHDYNGTAQSLLQENLINADTFILPPPKDALEFRTLMCMARMAQTALGRFGVSTADQEKKVTRLNREPGAFQSRNWTVAHVRLGEMQTLEALKGVAFASLRAFEDKMNSAPEYTMRDKPCPRANLQPLLRYVNIGLYTSSWLV